MLLDIEVVVALVVAAIYGFRCGLIQPVVAEFGFFLAIWVMLMERTRFDHLVSRAHLPGIVDPLIGLALAIAVLLASNRLGRMLRERLDWLAGVDGLLGVFGNAFFIGLALYAQLSALIVLDRAFMPLAQANTLNARQVAALRSQIEGNPFTRVLVDPLELQKLSVDAAGEAGARLETAEQLAIIYNVYVDLVRPVVTGSRLAPGLMGFYRHLPGIGHFGPRDLPKDTKPPPAARPAAASVPAPGARPGQG